MCLRIYGFYVLGKIQGNQGTQGPAGLKGIKGEKGDIGDKGILGPDGDKGPAGMSGDAGPAGPIGNAGSQASTASLDSMRANTFAPPPPPPPPMFCSPRDHLGRMDLLGPKVPVGAKDLKVHLDWLETLVIVVQLAQQDLL